MLLAEPEPTPADLRFRLGGLPVRVHPLFWVVTAMLGWNQDEGLEGVAWWVLVVFVAILVHELGHALTARAFGASGVRIVLYLLGGLAISEGGLSRRQRIVELAMGPGAGFLLFGLVWCAVKLGGGPDMLPLRIGIAYHDLKWVCLAWGLVNLLPIYPLDGGQIAAELFVARRGSLEGILATFKLGCLTAALVCGSFIYLYFTQGQGARAALFFFGLALLSGLALSRLRAQAARGREHPDDDLMPHERNEWERDPDWWKGR